MSSDLNNFVSVLTTKLNRTEDEMTEMFYLLRLFESQYNPETDGDLQIYLFTRLESYHSTV